MKTMSTLTMPSSSYPYSFPYHMTWQDTCSQPRPGSGEQITLPSIHQAFPEFHLPVDTPARTSSSATTPTGRSFSSTTTPPEYVHSPTHQKRRRLSFECRNDLERTNSVPRLYPNSCESDLRPPSPDTFRRMHTKAWNERRRASPRPGIHMSSPASIEPHERIETRPTLPSLTHLHLGRGATETRQVRDQTSDEYTQELMRRRSVTSTSSHRTEGESPAYPSENYAYRFHHPTRVQSLSLGSVHHFDRTPFSPGLSPRPYDHRFHDNYMHMRDYGVGINGEGKQRKRRGNLPKETTDKLRAWFVAHLHHPYPSEEEKQDLMRQTGLQLNQISNWFINARRRQLPTMINNARAESDAMTVRGGESKLLPSTERTDYESDSKPLSDGESSPFRDVELETIKRRRVTNINRGSI
ncbi:hypothetical protein F5Y05DRAFT_363422 [Hypoxylon sp. FL0543]|nr:hypothetical protein F5Y05DRAFT_363422 [Hypoxylon sp. FL0543]